MTTRRAFVGLLAATPLAACQMNAADRLPPVATADAGFDRWYVGSRPDEPFDIPLVDRNLMDPELRPQNVAFASGQAPGTVIVDVDERRLYLQGENGRALRYGVGVGRQGFAWRGRATVGRKAKWPAWSPTGTMVRLRIATAGHREAGLENPLGARALYLYQGSRDTMFRIHGTNEPWSIGEQVSAGCVRMLNEDVADLYERVPVGAVAMVRRNGRFRV